MDLIVSVSKFFYLLCGLVKKFVRALSFRLDIFIRVGTKLYQ